MLDARPRRPTRDVPPLPLDPSSASTASSHTQSESSSQPPSSPTASPGDTDDGAHPPATAPLDAHETISPGEPLHAPSSAPARPRSPADETALTPLRAHYLKKSLIELQFDRELTQLTKSGPDNTPALAYLGAPFAPPPKDAPPVDLPLLRFVFRQFVLTFPFLAAAPRDFFPDKLQPFVKSVLGRNLSPASVMDEAEPGAGDEATRLRLKHKIQRNLALFVGSATKVAEKEEVVRLTQADLDRLETLAKRRQAKDARDRGAFEVNVVCVRTVVERHRIRSKAHEEFIIRTRRSGQEDVFVSRRYGDFKTLADTLKQAHPGTDIPNPPSKDRATASAPPSNPTSPVPPALARAPTSSSFGSNLSVDSASTAGPSSPLSPSGSGPRLGISNAMRLTREKNRLTLRAYLHSLMASGTLASSPVLRNFLLSGPTMLSAEELMDARRREEADRLREDGRKRFAKEIALRVEGLRDALRDVKGDLMGQGGLTRIFATIKEVDDVRKLPVSYKAVLEWARISLASTVFQHLVAADNASETLASLKRIHGLMPYFMLKAALKISNPVGMIRTVLDLFMAQPFGKQSLLQRMFTSSLMEEVKELEENIAAVEDKIDDPVICEKVRQYISASKEIQAIYKADAAEENINVLAVVLRSGDAPMLSRPQLNRVMRCHRAYVAYTRQRERLADSDDDEGPEDEDAWLFEDLTVLGKLYARLRDRQQIIELIFEGTTADLLKDIITIFYAPLAQVYRAASIADSIGDLQTFITDLIRTVEQVDETTQADPQRTVKIFIDLIQRHEQSFYSFVHKVHSKGESLFTDLMQWIELFLTLARDGLSSEPLSLEFLLPHATSERAAVLSEVDAVALYHYKLKVAYEERLRRRFGRTQANSDARADADAEDAAAQALVAGVVDELSFGELMQGDALDVAAADYDSETDSGSSDESSSEGDSDTDSYETAEEDNQVANLPARAKTVSHRGPVSAPAQERRSHDVHRAPAAPGVRPSRSMTFTGRTPKPKDLAPVPPVPHLARPSVPKSPRKKAFPQSPSRQQRYRSLSRPRPDEADSKVKEKARRKRQPPEPIQPPELQHIPDLLPIFVEMIRPALRPRQR